MEPNRGRDDLADELLRRRAHAAHDQLQLYFTLRVLSEALPTRRHRVRRHAPILLAGGLVVAVAAVGVAFGAHLAPSTTQRPGRALPTLSMVTPATPDAVTSGILSAAVDNLRNAPSYRVSVVDLRCDSGTLQGVHPRVNADLTVLRNGDLTGTASVAGATNPQPFAVTRVAGQIYVRGRSLWDTVDPASTPVYGDSWVNTGTFTATNPAGDPSHRQLRSVICALNGTADTVTRFAQALQGASKVSDTSFQGHTAITVRDSGDSANDPVSVVVVGPPAVPGVLAGTTALRSSVYGVTASSFTIDRVGSPATVSAPATSLSAG